MQGTAARLLRERREALDLTQWEVSRRADVREYDISRWERGVTKTLPLLGMWKISRVLDFTLEELAEALLEDEANAAGSGRSAPGSAIQEVAAKAASRASDGAGRKPRR